MEKEAEEHEREVAYQAEVRTPSSEDEVKEGEAKEESFDWDAMEDEMEEGEAKEEFSGIGVKLEEEEVEPPAKLPRFACKKSAAKKRKAKSSSVKLEPESTGMAEEVNDADAPGPAANF